MIAQTAAYRASTERAAIKIAGGLRSELYRRRDGQTQSFWTPQRPDFKRREVRAYVPSYYDLLVEKF